MIWHDVINNSITRHRSNNFNPVSGEKLVAILKGYPAKISAIVYCQRIGTEEIFEKLKNSSILTISIVIHLISKRKAEDTGFRKHYLALHQPDVLEIKLSRSFADTTKTLELLLLTLRD